MAVMMPMYVSQKVILTNLLHYQFYSHQLFGNIDYYISMLNLADVEGD